MILQGMLIQVAHRASTKLLPRTPTTCQQPRRPLMSTC